MTIMKNVPLGMHPQIDDAFRKMSKQKISPEDYVEKLTISVFEQIHSTYFSKHDKVTCIQKLKECYILAMKSVFWKGENNFSYFLENAEGNRPLLKFYNENKDGFLAEVECNKPLFYLTKDNVLLWGDYLKQIRFLKGLKNELSTEDLEYWLPLLSARAKIFDYHTSNILLGLFLKYAIYDCVSIFRFDFGWTGIITFKSKDLAWKFENLTDSHKRISIEAKKKNSTSKTTVDETAQKILNNKIICFVCATISTEKLPTCKVCRSARYCSLECQKLDWTAHKHFCKE